MTSSASMAAHPRPETKPAPGRRALKRLLGMPTVLKVLLANVTMATAGAALVTVMGAGLSSTEIGGQVQIQWRAFWFLFALGVPTAFLVNLAVLRLAFLPLSSLVNTMEDVSRGDTSVRAREGLLSDPLTSRMLETFNRMLDDLEASRRRLEEMAGKVVTAQEEERARLSRELHDNAGQVLTLAVLAVNSLRSCRNPDEIAGRAAEAEAVIVQAAEEVRRAALELRPVMLDDLGLGPALEWYVRQSGIAMGIPVDMRLAGLDRRFPRATELTVYRAVQEALTNVAKHAGASRVSVDVERNGDTLLATVTDDGRGFDPREAERKQEGLGLFSMKERVALLGGTLLIRSEAGRGSSIRVELPLPRDASG